MIGGKILKGQHYKRLNGGHAAAGIPLDHASEGVRGNGHERESRGKAPSQPAMARRCKGRRVGRRGRGRRRWLPKSNGRSIAPCRKVDDDAIGLSRTAVIVFQILAEAADLCPDYGVQFRIEIGWALENVHAHGVLVDAISLASQSTLYQITEQALPATRQAKPGGGQQSVE